MNINIKKILTPLSYGIILAQDPPRVGDITSGTSLPQGNFDSTLDLVNGVATWIFGFISALAVVAIVYSGIMYMTAGGDTAKADTAKKNLTWAITGLIIAVLAWFISNEVVTNIF